MKSKLNSVELSVYFIVWILANIFSLYKLFEAQTEILANNPHKQRSLEDLQPGWSYLSRYKDTSDIEYTSWKYLIHTSWFYFIIQFIISEILRRSSAGHLKYWYIISSALYVTLHMGMRQLLIIVSQPLLYSVLMLCGAKKTMIWTASIAILLSYNSVKYKSFFWYFLEHENMYDEEVYLIIFCVAWVDLRCLSFCVDYIDRDKMSPTNSTMTETFINLLSYALYIPLLYTGPILLYEEFEKSFHVKNENLLTRIKTFLWDIALFSLYTLLLDISLHYIYFHAMQSDMELIRKLPALALCGGGLWMGLHFHVKYVIAYGTTTAFARLDNMETPPTPRCIARVHVYSQMWRYFDVGLYRFLVKYIYKPVYLALSTHFNWSLITNKLLASLTTFMFIFMWHGTIKRIFVWTLLNYIGITTEHISKAISESDSYKWFKKNVLITEAMEARFIGVLCVPLLILSAISNFYLFADVEVGDLFFESFLRPSLFNSLVIFTSLYCCCQVSKALEDVPSRTDYSSGNKVSQKVCPVQKQSSQE